MAAILFFFFEVLAHSSKKGPFSSNMDPWAETSKFQYKTSNFRKIEILTVKNRKIEKVTKQFIFSYFRLMGDKWISFGSFSIGTQFVFCNFHNFEWKIENLFIEKSKFKHTIDLFFFENWNMKLRSCDVTTSKLWRQNF